jgi:hypothetical protein
MLDEQSATNFPPLNLDGIVNESAFGFPFRCLYFRDLFTSDEATPERPRSIIEPMPLASTAFEFPLIPNWAWYHNGKWPTRILWPGFLLNTLFWSVVIASPFWLRRGFVAWRSARRRRAGLCPLCGYARGGINPQHPCPECGKSVPPAPQSTPSNAHTP